MARAQFSLRSFLVACAVCSTSLGVAGPPVARVIAQWWQPPAPVQPPIGEEIICVLPVE